MAEGNETMDKAGGIEEVGGESDKMKGGKGKGKGGPIPSHPIPSSCSVLRHRRPFCLLFNARLRMHYTVYIIYISLWKIGIRPFPERKIFRRLISILLYCSSSRRFVATILFILLLSTSIFFNNLLAVSLTFYELMNKLSIKAAESLSIFIKTFSYSEVSVLSFIFT